MSRRGGGSGARTRPLLWLLAGAAVALIAFGLWLRPEREATSSVQAPHTAPDSEPDEGPVALAPSANPPVSRQPESGGPTGSATGDRPPEPAAAELRFELEVVLVPQEAGLRIEGLPVSVRPAMEHQAWGEVERSDSEGRARFTVGPGWWSVWSANAARVNVEVSGPSRPIQVELALEAGAELLGQVVGESGAPVPGAEVWVAQYSSDFVPGLAFTDAAGRFRLRPGPARYVGARAPGFGPSRWVRIDDSEVGVGVEVVLVLQAGGAVRGRVVDQQGVGLAGAVLEARRADNRHGPQLTRSDEDGGFAFEGLAAGKCTIVAAARGFAPELVRVNVEATGVVHHDLRLRRGVEVTGRLLLADGNPAAGADVFSGAEAGRRGGLYEVATRADEDGRYTLRDLRPGRPTLRIQAVGARELVHTFDEPLEPGSMVRFDATLPAGLALRGRVVDALGAPAAVRVYAVHQSYEGRWRADAGTDANGWFELPTPQDGEHGLEVVPDDVASEAPVSIWDTQDARPGEDLFIQLPEYERRED